MAARILCQERPTKYKLEKPQFPDLNSSTTLDSLVGPLSWSLFDAIPKTDPTFLKESPDNWESDRGYCEVRDFVRHVKVVNDCAERGVATISSYCNILTKDSDMRMWLINTVETNKKNIPTSRKRLLITKKTVKYSTVQ